MNKKNNAMLIFSILIFSMLGFSNRYTHNQSNYICEVYPTKNAMVSSQSPNNNYSTSEYLFAGESNTSGNIVRSFFEFDLSSCLIGETSNIISVELHVFQYSELSSNNSIIDLHLIENITWSQGSLTWSNQPPYELNISSRSFLPNESNGIKIFPINTIALTEVQNNIMSFVLKSQSEVNDLYQFYSSRSSNVINRPKLVINISNENYVTPTFTPVSTYTQYYPPSNNPIPESLRGNLSLYALMGQSNMSGRGTVPSQQLVGSVYNFKNDYHWGIAIEPVDSPYGQVDEVSADPPNAGYSPSLFFGLNMNQNIGLIPCAKGGSSINDWQFSYGDDTLFGSCWKRILSASQMGDLKGILFFQGETDSKTYANANLWGIRFEQFVESIREVYGDVPIVFAQIGDIQSSTFPYADIVRTQQLLVDLYCVYMITTDDLPTTNGHFNVLGYQAIGIRFAEKMKSINCQ